MSILNKLTFYSICLFVLACGGYSPAAASPVAATLLFQPAGNHLTSEKPPEFNLPLAVFLDKAGKIYITDTNNRIIRMDDMSGANWTEYGSEGNGQGQFSFPLGIFVDSSGKIYIADSGNNRIVRMDDMTGKNWIAFGVQGNGRGQFDGPYWVYVDVAGKIYVVDNLNNRIVRMDDMTGKNWVAFGSQGSGIGQFNYPIGLTVDAAGKIYVADADNQRIVCLENMTGSNWQRIVRGRDKKNFNLVAYGTLGSGVGQFNKIPDVFKGPQSVVVDTAGRIYITDAGNHRLVRIDDCTGKNWTTFGETGEGEGQQNGSVGIFVDPKGLIYFTDSFNNRLVRINDMNGAGWVSYP